MKHYLIPMTVAIALPAFGGTPVEPMMDTPPPVTPSLADWFVGGTYGQLPNVDVGSGTELDFDLYSIHVGRMLSNDSGFKSAVYLEIAYAEASENLLIPTGLTALTFTNAEFEESMLPVTLNYAMEGQLFGDLSWYLTAGVGYAWTDGSLKSALGNVSADGGGFVTQASVGLRYYIMENLDVFGGARWIYLGDLDLGNGSFADDDSAIGWEIGLRGHF